MTLAEEIWGRLSGHEGAGEIGADALSARFDILETLAEGVPGADLGGLQTPPVIQTSTTITQIPPVGICIETPGTYTLANSIEWTPAAAGAAITIACPGVTLDLNNQTLKISPALIVVEAAARGAEGTVPGREAGLVGVRVVLDQFDATAPADPASYTVPSKETLGAETVARLHGNAGTVIMNGTIATPMRGVHCSGASGLSLQQLTICSVDGTPPVATSGWPAGIFIEKCADVVLDQCTVENLTVMAPTYCGVLVGESVAVTIVGCTVQGLVNLDGSAQGFSFYLCVGIACGANSVSEVTTEYQGIIDTGSHTSIGYLPMASIGAIFLGCSAENIAGCCDDCHGMSVFIIAEVLVAEFVASNIVDGRFIRNTGAKATGIEVYGWGILIEDCQVTGIRAHRPQDLQCAGYSSWGSEISFLNCTATTVQVLDQQGDPDMAWGYGIGFGWAPDPRPNFRNGNATGVAYSGCTATDCQVGFDTWKHVSGRWIGAAQNNCVVPVLVESHATYRELSMDYGSESPTGMPYFARIKNTASNNNLDALIAGAGS